MHDQSQWWDPALPVLRRFPSLFPFRILAITNRVSNVKFYDFQADLCKSLVAGPNIPTTFYTEGNNATSKQRQYLNLVGQALVGRPGGGLGGG